jgi:hypothetical protein
VNALRNICRRRSVKPSPLKGYGIHTSLRASQPSCNFALSARLRGEREGTRRDRDGEGEVGHAATTEPGFPHLTPTLSALRGGEGGFNKLLHRLHDV